MEESKSKNSKSERFISQVIVWNADTGIAAKLRRGNNPATEYMAWEYISSWCDLTNPFQLQPYLTVAAAVAKEKIKVDGNLGLGQALALCYPEKSDSDPAKARLRRILSCTDNLEVCSLLRSILGFISAKGIPISYAKLLDDLLYFSERTRKKWAMDFYRTGKGGLQDDSDKNSD
ncbi:MAG: type I-E CRISPR-associated protein Cse2/CasB [Sphaerochaeta sp.]